MQTFINESENFKFGGIMDQVCSSSGKKIANDSGSVKFPCPSCGKAIIVRSSNSRAIAAKYTCPNCGFKMGKNK